MKKLLSVLVGAVMVPAIAFTSVSAVDAGQIEGGDIYRVKNVTTGTDFTDPVNATCGQTVQFKVRIHNIGAFALENVRVAATLPSNAATSHSSMVTVSASNANAKTDTAGVNLDRAGSLRYVAGSTDLLDANSSKLSTLPDGITSGGVNLPAPVGVSAEQKRFVQFQATVDCPPTPPVTPPTTPPVTPPAPTKPVTPAAPQVLAATGPAETFAQIVGVTALAGAISYYIRSRRANILG